ncbi:MAG: hypothetical protein DRO40_03555 [Thermoprotei archaeon]|nr:MAG: hypothetical protein DRO40_03555 [Thermoprotei archaeon]
MTTSIKIYGAYIHGYGKEYYLVEFKETELILCKTFEKLDIRRHRYSHVINGMIKSIRIKRGTTETCTNVSYKDIKVLKHKIVDDEFILILNTASKKLIIHFPRKKEHLVRKGIKLIKKYIDFEKIR